ncbi:hypothetical protein [Thiomonas sp.]|uniref:hypothetical protein n=1 Tax=Thiomonas sp. TaxID=2047785 RepID=UPI002608A2D3|nr:hypothetical protein [Thiomonas sp.]
MKTYPRGFGLLLHTVLLALLASGLLLFPGALRTHWEWDLPWALSAGQRVGVAALHAAAFMAVLTVLGALWTVHIRAGWVRRENLRSGVALLGLFGLLAISGLGLYYAGNEHLQSWSALAHLLAAGLLPVAYVAHRLGARAAAARAWPVWCRRGQPPQARAATTRTAPPVSQTVSTPS